MIVWAKAPASRSVEPASQRIGEPPCAAAQPQAIEAALNNRSLEMCWRTAQPVKPTLVEISEAVLAMDGRQVVIYNKPTYGLDLQSIRNARSAILAQAERGVAGLLISTDLEELLELSDRIAVMYRGRLVGILEGPGLSRRRLGELMVGREHAQ